MDQYSTTSIAVLLTLVAYTSNSNSTMSSIVAIIIPLAITLLLVALGPFLLYNQFISVYYSSTNHLDMGQRSWHGP